MCPLRYILIILSCGFALFVVIGGAAYTPEFIMEAEQKRQEVWFDIMRFVLTKYINKTTKLIQKNRKWYETLWDFAWGKFLIDVWSEAVKKEKEKDKLINKF